MPTTAEPRHKALRVLIVEDEMRLRDLLATTIPEMGFPASAVRGGEEALRAMQSDPSDIVLLDLQLPLMNGMELFEQIRARWPKTQVIVLTGYGDLPTAQRAIRLNVVEFLSKPCHLRDLELALDRARRRHEEQRALESVASSGSSPAISPPAPSVTATLAEVEYQQILATLRRHHGNKTTAAAELGISRRTLHYKLAEYRQRGFATE